MPDIDKAIAFARECLKWRNPALASNSRGKLIVMDYQDPGRSLDLSNFQTHLEAFLSKRYFIEISGGIAAAGRWSAVVGLRSRAGSTAADGLAPVESDDMHDAIFDACVAAVRLYPET